MAKELTLTGLLEKAASDNPERTAISVRGKELKFDLTHARLQKLVVYAAALLIASGVNVGDVVALAFPSTVEFVIMFLAVIRCRATAAPLNPAYKAETFERYLSKSQSKLLLTPHEGNQRAQSAASKLKIPHLTAKLHSTDSKISLSSTGIVPDLDSMSKVVNDPSDVALFLRYYSGASHSKAMRFTQEELATEVLSHNSHMLNYLEIRAVSEYPLILYECLVRELLRYLVAGAPVALLAATAAARSPGNARRHTANKVDRVPYTSEVARPYRSNAMPEGNNGPKTTKENKTKTSLKESKTKTERGGEEGGHSINLTEEFEKLSIPKKFYYEELRSATNYFASDQKLGEGGFGIVYKGHIGKARTPVAVKEITSGASQGIREYKSEVKSMSQLRHRNLVRLLGYCHEATKFVLVYEFVGGGTLYDRLFKGRTSLTWTMRYNIARGLASALYYLQEECHECVIHRDIKSSNVMLDEKFEAKLGDFGLAKLVDHTRDPSRTQPKGTPGYWDPEYFQTGITSKESDIYSFGMVLLEIVCGRKAVDQERDPPHLVEWVQKQYGPRKSLQAVDKKLGKDFDRKQAEALMTMGLQCAHCTASSRPSIESVMAIFNSMAKPPKLPSMMPGF